jgi:phospholipase C
MTMWDGAYHGGFTFDHGSLFDALGAQSVNWIIYRGDVGPVSGSLPIAGALKGVSMAPWDSNVKTFSTFAADLNGAYPYQFTWIEPNYGSALDNSYRNGTSQHPMDVVTGGEGLIKQTYEAIRNSPLWESSLLIVTWDEHGGFFDHVAPVAATPPGDTITAPSPLNDPINQFGFTFDLYGVRVPGVIVSPFIPSNTIDHRLYDHSSIPATMEELFGFAPLTKRDAAAAGVKQLLTLSEPRSNTPTTLPDPATAAETPAAPEPLSAAELAQPLGHSNLAGFLHVALRADLQMTPPEENAAILAHVAAFTTRGEALAYIEDVASRLNEAAGALPAG